MISFSIYLIDEWKSNKNVNFRLQCCWYWLNLFFIAHSENDSIFTSLTFAHNICQLSTTEFQIFSFDTVFNMSLMIYKQYYFCTINYSSATVEFYKIKLNWKCKVYAVMTAMKMTSLWFILNNWKYFKTNNLCFIIVKPTTNENCKLSLKFMNLHFNQSSFNLYPKFQFSSHKCHSIVIINFNH